MNSKVTSMKSTAEKTQTRSTEEITESLCKTVREAKLDTRETIKVISHFIYSIGNTLEKCSGLSSKDVLLRYAENPTLGNALMAQALWMKETWTTENGKENTE